MSRTGTTGHILRLATAGFLLQLIVLSLPEPSQADGISGFMEYNFSKTDSKARELDGSTAKTTGNALIQRYNLALDRTIYPNLHFSAGGNVAFSRSEFESETVTQTTSLTSKQSRFTPFANLRLNAGVTSAGLGYSRRQERTAASGAEPFTSITDNYSAQLGFRPHGLPTVDLFYMHLDSYDEERTLQDSSNNTIMFNTKYSLIKNMDLNYQAMFNNLQDRLRGQENSSLNQNARVAYNDTLFNDRVTLYSTYSLASQSAETVSNRAGEILTTLNGVPTYYKDEAATGATDTDSVLIGTLAENTLLGDRNIATAVTVLSEITTTNGQVTSITTDTEPKSIGMKLPTGSTVNVITLLTTSSLPTPMAGKEYLLRRFSWELYQSTDSTGREWRRVQALDGSHMLVETDAFYSTPQTTAYAIRFRFPQVTTDTATSFLKIVMTPQISIPLPTDPGTFSVAEVQASLSATAPAGRSSSSSMSGHYEFNGRVKIMDAPSLFYDMNFTLDHFNSNNGSSQRYFVTNSLSLAHQFNSTLSGNARVTREDSFDPGSSRSALLYSASLTATPIPALTSSLLFSGRNEEFDGQTADSYSLFLNTSAELYRGVNVLFNGGATTATSATGRQAQNALFMIATNLIPHRAANINMSIAGRQEWGTGGGVPDSESYKQDNEISMTLNPLKSVYLFGSFSLTTETGKKAATNRAMGGSWAPFRDGNLLYNISYNENATSESSQESRSLAQSLRWYFRSSSYFDLSYLISRNSSLTQKVDSYSLNASARFTF